MQQDGKTLSRDFRLNLLTIAWAAVIVITFPGIMYFWMFPAGLYRLFGKHQTDFLQSGGYFALGWLAFIGLTIAASLCKRKYAYFALYIILCILLALTSFGCRAFWSEFRQIS